MPQFASQNDNDDTNFCGVLLLFCITSTDKTHLLELHSFLSCSVFCEHFKCLKICGLAFARLFSFNNDLRFFTFSPKARLCFLFCAWCVFLFLCCDRRMPSFFYFKMAFIFAVLQRIKNHFKFFTKMLINV